MDATLIRRLQDPLPRDLTEVAELVVQHKDFEESLQGHEPEVEAVQENFQALSPTKRTAAIENKMSAAIEKWEDLWSQANVYVER